MKIPFLDLKAQYLSIKKEIDLAISEVIESHQFIQGSFAEKFSLDFLKVHGGKYAVSCSNGTSAITAILKCLGVGPGDEVIAPANTFIATVEPINEVGAKIVLADADPLTYGINLKHLEKLITKKTKAIIPVHLYGNALPMDDILELTKNKNIHVIEDSAQAHLSKFNDKPVGTFGVAGTFSFYPGKNLGAYGDAGLILVNDEKLFNKVKMYIDHGRKSKYEHEFMGTNFRMDGIQAAILSVKTKYLNKWTNLRIEIANKYDKTLKEKGFKVIEKNKGGECVYHLYVVEVSNRDEVIKYLKEKDIETGIHYPVPLYEQEAIKKVDCKIDSYPISDKFKTRILSLPIYPEITNEMINYVLKCFLEKAKV